MESVAGEVVADASGHGHDATCSVVDATCPVVVAGKHGNALRFDGVNDHLAVASSPDFETITGFTVTAWLWIDASPNSMYYCFANKGLGTQTNDTWQTCVTTSRAIFFGTGTDAVAGDSMYSNSSSVPLATWQHVAIRWDGTTKTIFLGGASVATKQASATFDGSALLLGYDLDNGSPVAPFAGILDEVRIYNRALSDGEIALLAQ